MIDIRAFLALLLLSTQATYAGVDATLVLVPKSWDHTSALPVAVWLHGYRANPSRILEDANYQITADSLNIAIVGVPATREAGSNSYIWSELPEYDLERVQKSLSEAERRLGAKFSSRVLFGFSQGAVVAAELAARYPTIFEGAIVLSPGADIFPTPIAATDGNKRQKYFISTGAGEAPGNLRFAREYHKILSALGSQVTYREVPGMHEHGRPPDWPDRFREWVSAILTTEPTPAAVH